VTDIWDVAPCGLVQVAIVALMMEVNIPQGVIKCKECVCVCVCVLTSCATIRCSRSTLYSIDLVSLLLCRLRGGSACF
jgi:hypothetical protein